MRQQINNEEAAAAAARGEQKRRIRNVTYELAKRHSERSRMQYSHMMIYQKAIKVVFRQFYRSFYYFFSFLCFSGESTFPFAPAADARALQRTLRAKKSENIYHRLQFLFIYCLNCEPCKRSLCDSMLHLALAARPERQGNGRPKCDAKSGIKIIVKSSHINNINNIPMCLFIFLSLCLALAPGCCQRHRHFADCEKLIRCILPLVSSECVAS